MIYTSLLEAIGRTPVVHLKRYSKAVGVKVYAKLESLNPGGSHKARIALGMLLDAEQRGLLKRGSGQTIVEPSGGNTGIGLAIAANLLGYQLWLVIPDNYSVEKQKLLRLYGAKVVLSDSTRGNNSHGEKALEIQMENPGFVMLNQQRNLARTSRQEFGFCAFLTKQVSPRPRRTGCRPVQEGLGSDVKSGARKNRTDPVWIMKERLF